MNNIKKTFNDLCISLFGKKGFSTLEYPIVLIIVMSGIIIMGPYVVRSWNANLQGWEDSVMDTHTDPLVIAPDNLPAGICSCLPLANTGACDGAKVTPGGTVDCSSDVFTVLWAADCTPLGCEFDETNWPLTAQCRADPGCCLETRMECGANTTPGTNGMVGGICQVALGYDAALGCRCPDGTREIRRECGDPSSDPSNPQSIVTYRCATDWLDCTDPDPLNNPPGCDNGTPGDTTDDDNDESCLFSCTGSDPTNLWQFDPYATAMCPGTDINLTMSQDWSFVDGAIPASGTPNDCDPNNKCTWPCADNAHWNGTVCDCNNGFWYDDTTADGDPDTFICECDFPRYVDGSGDCVCPPGSDVIDQGVNNPPTCGCSDPNKSLFYLGDDSDPGETGISGQCNSGSFECVQANSTYIMSINSWITSAPNPPYPNVNNPSVNPAPGAGGACPHGDWRGGAPLSVEGCNGTCLGLYYP